jgi:hypothetical protein
MRGWRYESARHALAARGMKSGGSAYFVQRVPRWRVDQHSVRSEDMGYVEMKMKEDAEREDRFKAYMDSLSENERVELRKKLETGRKGFLSSKETPVEYIQENVRSTEKGDRTEHFKQGVKDVLFHPWQEADKDWRSYNRAAGTKMSLSNNPVERWNQRGAGLFGRVVTMANVEPLLDKEKGKNFRQSILDIEFGRRS